MISTHMIIMNVLNLSFLTFSVKGQNIIKVSWVDGMNGSITPMNGKQIFMVVNNNNVCQLYR